MNTIDKINTVAGLTDTIPSGLPIFSRQNVQTRSLSSIGAGDVPNGWLTLCQRQSLWACSSDSLSWK